MRGGLWETIDQLMDYMSEGKVINEERINRLGSDDVCKFWKWESTCTFHP